MFYWSAAMGRILRVTCLPLLVIANVQVVQSSATETSGGQTLSLNKAIVAALANDPWQAGNRHRQTAYEAQSVAAGTLPDPRVSVNFANLPTDTFDFNQEAMTQFRVGVTQMFPRGQSLRMKQQYMAVLGSQHPLLAADREAQVTLTVSQLWLDVYQASASIEAIESNRALFEQLVDVAIASYSNALGRTRQQDVIRAQLELTRLQDRLVRLQQDRDMGSQQLMEWLADGPGLNGDTEGGLLYSRNHMQGFSLPDELPQVRLRRSPLPVNDEFDQKHLMSHPAVLALDRLVEAARVGVELARQKYKSEWGVSASYAYREDDPSGLDRSDFFSLGISFDLPVFTANRQDKQVRSAAAKAEEIRSRKWLLLRRMTSELATAAKQLGHVDQRQRIFLDQLLPQMQEQAEASLAAYTNDDGDFAEVVRARIALLNTEIESLQIAVERQKTVAQLNYLLTSFAGSETAELATTPFDTAGEIR
ncbi:MAG: TolC family protein [Halieaceae bacterium]|jgi:outer membrane protein TolC|nr:TolC family protein [Halieaceae bacterium]